MQLQDLKPSFSSLSSQEQILLVQRIQASRLIPKAPKSPIQKKIQERVQTKSKREKQIEEIQSLLDMLN